MYKGIYVYDESSPSCLRWAVNRWAGAARKILCAKEGAAAGYLNPDGYWRVRTNSKNARKGHLVIWEMFYGTIKKNWVIDHINRDTTDNRISNLRMITRCKSARNKGKPKNNTSGVVGVKKNCKKWKGGVLEYWLAEVMGLDGKRVVKHFSIKKLGDGEAFKLACEWRSGKILELNSLGAGYTADHGK